jgi:hypothetical protein
LTDLKVEGPDAPQFLLDQVPVLPTTVELGEMVTLDIVYQPTVAGAALGSLRVSSDAANASEVVVILRGRGLPVPVPQLEVSPPMLDFGEVVVGQARTRTLTLHNTGTADLHLSDAVLDNTADFSLSSPLPTTVRPGDMVTIDVTFVPPAEETLSGTLLLRSDAADVEVSLQGTGIPASGSTGSTGGTDS